MHRPLVGAIAAAFSLAAGCDRPLAEPTTIRQLAPVQAEGAASWTASGQLVLQIRTKRSVSFIRELDWERATATLTNADGSIPALSSTVNATVDAQAGRSASLRFAPIKPSAGYTLAIALERRDASGAWQTVASGSVGSLTLSPGANTVSVPLSATANGELVVSVPSPKLPPLPTITDIYPTSGSIGMYVRASGTGFASAPAGEQVTFNGTSATVVSGTTTTFQASVPGGATTGPIKVVVNGLPGSSSTFTVVPTGTLIDTYPVGAGPVGVATDSAGNIWVANKTDNSVSKLSYKGALLGTYGTGAGPHGVAIDSSDNVWVTNNSGTTVSKLDNNGNLLDTISVGSGPQDLAFDGSGNLWVTCHGANTLVKITPGRVVTSTATDAGPRCVAIDAGGNVWITTDANGLNKYNPLGSRVAQQNMGATPYGLGIDDALGFVWATDRNAKNLFQFNLSTLSSINKTNTGSPAEELVVDPGGNVWVTQPTSNTVVKMSTSDAILGTYAVGTSPGGIAMAPSRGILVTNSGSNTVSLLAL